MRNHSSAKQKSIQLHNIIRKEHIESKKKQLREIQLKLQIESQADNKYYNIIKMLQKDVLDTKAMRDLYIIYLKQYFVLDIQKVQLILPVVQRMLQKTRIKHTNCAMIDQNQSNFIDQLRITQHQEGIKQLNKVYKLLYDNAYQNEYQGIFHLPQCLTLSVSIIQKHPKDYQLLKIVIKFLSIQALRNDNKQFLHNETKILQILNDLSLDKVMFQFVLLYQNLFADENLILEEKQIHQIWQFFKRWPNIHSKRDKLDNTNKQMQKDNDGQNYNQQYNTLITQLGMLLKGDIRSSVAWQNLTFRLLKNFSQTQFYQQFKPIWYLNCVKIILSWIFCMQIFSDEQKQLILKISDNIWDKLFKKYHQYLDAQKIAKQINDTTCRLRQDDLHCELSKLIPDFCEIIYCLNNKFPLEMQRKHQKLIQILEDEDHKQFAYKYYVVILIVDRQNQLEKLSLQTLCNWYCQLVFSQYLGQTIYYRIKLAKALAGLRNQQKMTGQFLETIPKLFKKTSFKHLKEQDLIIPTLQQFEKEEYIRQQLHKHKILFDFTYLDLNNDQVEDSLLDRNQNIIEGQSRIKKDQIFEESYSIEQKYNQDK